MALSDEQIEEMVDEVIAKVQRVADERPVIFSAFLPLYLCISLVFFCTVQRLTILQASPTTTILWRVWRQNNRPACLQHC